MTITTKDMEIVSVTGVKSKKFTILNAYKTGRITGRLEIARIVQY